MIEQTAGSHEELNVEDPTIQMASNDDPTH